jgi:D-psicose/D-tagatose/L-ribulose 3-epimerase
MTQFGAHSFIWIDEWTVDKGNRAIIAAGETGFDFIEVPLLRPDRFDAAAHRQALAEVGIGATASLTTPEWAHMPAEPRQALRFLIEALNQVEALGSTTMTGCLAFSLGVFTNQPPTEAEWQTAVDTMGEVALEARKRGIRLGLEAVNRYEAYLYNTLGEARRLINDIGTDNIFLHADTYHMNIEEEGFYTPLVKNADLLGYIHMSESHRGLIGTGTVVWDDVFRALADGGYRGPLVLESFAAINPDLIAATKLWRPPNQPSEVMAWQGLKFLQEQAERYGL